MRILHLNDHLDWVGGIETYVLSIIPRLRERGVEQAAVFGKGDGAHVEHPVHVPEVSSPRPADRSTARKRVEQVLDEFGPDLVQIHNLYNVGAIEACLDRVPTVVYVHDFRYACPASSFYFRRPNVICERTCSAACFALGPLKRCLTPRIPLNLWYYQRVQWMKKNADRFSAIIAISHYVKDRLVETGFPAEKIHVIPYFCPLEPVAEPSPEPEQPRVLYIGRMARYKGFDQFIRVMSRLPADIQGTMIGNLNDGVQSQIDDLATRLGCRDRIDVRGWASREEIQAIYSRMSVVTFPSVCPETLGLVGMESMATGVPVVGFRVGGTGEWLRDGENGYSVDVNDVETFAKRVEALVRSPDTRQRFAENGLQMIRERFSPSRHLADLTAVYDSVAGSLVSTQKDSIEQ